MISQLIRTWVIPLMPCLSWGIVEIQCVWGGWGCMNDYSHCFIWAKCQLQEYCFRKSHVKCWKVRAEWSITPGSGGMAEPPACHIWKKKKIPGCVCPELDSSRLDRFTELQHISTIPQSQYLSATRLPPHRGRRVTLGSFKCKTRAVALQWGTSRLSNRPTLTSGLSGLDSSTTSVTESCHTISSCQAVPSCETVDGEEKCALAIWKRKAELLSSCSLYPHLLQPILRKSSYSCLGILKRLQ